MPRLQKQNEHWDGEEDKWMIGKRGGKIQLNESKPSAAHSATGAGYAGQKTDWTGNSHRFDDHIEKAYCGNSDDILLEFYSAFLSRRSLHLLPDDRHRVYRKTHCLAMGFA